MGLSVCVVLVVRNLKAAYYSRLDHKQDINVLASSREASEVCATRCHVNDSVPSVGKIEV